MKHGKKYVAAAKLIEKNKVYSVEEACELVKKTSCTKFDSTVGISFNLNIDGRKADQHVGSFHCGNAEFRHSAPDCRRPL